GRDAPPAPVVVARVVRPELLLLDELDVGDARAARLDRLALHAATVTVVAGAPGRRAGLRPVPPPTALASSFGRIRRRPTGTCPARGGGFTPPQRSRCSDTRMAT